MDAESDSSDEDPGKSVDILRVENDQEQRRSYFDQDHNPIADNDQDSCDDLNDQNTIQAVEYEPRDDQRSGQGSGDVTAGLGQGDLFGRPVPSSHVRPIGGSVCSNTAHASKPASGEEVLELVDAFVRRGEQTSYCNRVETRGESQNAINEVHVHMTQTNIHNPAAIALGGQVVVNPPRQKSEVSKTPRPPTEMQKLRYYRSASASPEVGETERNFEKWTKGMVETRALKVLLDKILQGRTWITITGSPGEGKTTAGYLVLKHLHSMGRQVYDIKTPEDYFRTKGSKQPILMLNDIFGSLHFDLQKVKKWEEVLSDILAMKEHKKEDVDAAEERKPTCRLTAILICRSSVLKQAHHHLGRFRDLVLNEECVVDLTHGMNVAAEERLEIWKSHSEHFSFDISDKVIQEVCEMSLPHGFPHCCRLFAAMYDKNRHLNIKAFFMKPLEFLNQTMESLMMDVTGPLLREMLKNDGSLQLNCVTDDERRFQYASVVETLTGTYLSQDNGTVTFHHPSIYDSAAFVVCKKDPLFVIKHCSLSFLNERVTFNGLHDCFETEIKDTVTISSEYTAVFMDRLKTELAKGNLSHALTHPSFHDEGFVFQFMNGILPPSEIQPLCDSVRHLIHARDRTSMESFLFLMTKSKSDKILKYVCQFVKLSQEDQTESLFGICEHTSVASIKFFLNVFHGIDINVKNAESLTPLLIATTKRSEHIIKLLLQKHADVIARDKKGNSPLLNLCKYGVDGDGDVVKLVIDKGADIKMKSLDFPFLPLHIACYEGHMNVATALLDRGEDVNERNVDGHTPLHCACFVRDKSALELLLNRGADVNKTDGNGYSPLHLSCYDGHLNVSTLLLDRGAEVNKTDIAGKIPLHAACFDGHLDLVSLLLDRGADINKADNVQNTALHDTCYKGQMDVVLFLIEHGADINKANIAGNTPLHRACDEGHVDVITVLIEKGADINKTNSDGDTPLNRLGLIGDVNITNFLIERGADVNKANITGCMPLHRACDMGHVDVVNLLAEKGADINTINSEGNTPFLGASLKGNLGVMDYLLGRGMDISWVDSKGNTPLHRACYDGCVDTITFLLGRGAEINKKNMNGNTPFLHSFMRVNVAVMTLLLDRGADINMGNILGNTPLHTACDEGHVDLITILVERGANMNKPNIDANTPLHIACLRRNTEVITLVIKKGAEINKTNSDGNTPLNILVNAFYIASYHRDVVRFLLKSGANINTSNNQGNTPLHAACTWEITDVIHLLVEKGADVTKTNCEGNTPLHLLLDASYDSCVDIVTLLLEKGADVNKPNSKGNIPIQMLLYCRVRPHLDVINLLLKRGTDINEFNRKAPLCDACHAGHVAVVTRLLDFAADINKSDGTGDIPLHAACYGGHLDVVKVLLVDGAEINKSGRHKSTPLHIACSQGHVDVVNYLLDGGGDINKKSTFGATPLHTACTRRHVNVVKALINKGADVNMTDSLGITPFYEALKRKYMDIVTVFLDRGDINEADDVGNTLLIKACEEADLAVMMFLLDRGADMNITNHVGNTPLHKSCKEGHVDGIKLLLDRGADINITNNIGYTPLIAACFHGRLNTITVLLDRGVDVGKASNDGYTALHAACVFGHITVVTTLLNRGADINKTSNGGSTPLHIACFYEHVDLISYLIEQGANNKK